MISTEIKKAILTGIMKGIILAMIAIALKYGIEIIEKECGLIMDSVALTEQIMLVPKSVLFDKIGECDRITINAIDKAILVQFGLLAKIQATIAKWKQKCVVAA